MAYETLLTSLEDGVMTVTLKRPEKLNAFDTVMSKELIGFFQVLGGQEQGDTFSNQAFNHSPHFHTSARIKSSCRFIKEEDFGTNDE